MSFTRTKLLTDEAYSPTDPDAEADIRAQVDGSIDEVFQFFNPYFDTLNPSVSAQAIAAYNGTNPAFVSFKSDNALQKVYHVKSFGAVGDGTDETTKIKNAIESLTPGSKLIFDSTKTYKVKSTAFIKNSFVELDGMGCSIQSISDSANIIFDTESTLYKVVNDSGVSVIANKAEITLPDVTGIAVGDLIIAYNSTLVNQYNKGIFSEIIRIVGSKIYIAHPSNVDFVADRITLYKSYQGIKIHHFNINCTDYDMAIGLGYAKNSIVCNNIINGNGARIGIWNYRSINCTIKDNYIYAFHDDLLVDNLSGYGIQLNGHNLTAEKNIIKDSKHCITSGERLFRCTEIKFRDNEVYAGTDTNLALLDFHSNCSGEISNNYVYTLNNVAGIVVRCNDTIIRKNKIISDKNSTTAINCIIIGSSVDETPTLDNIEIIGNEAYGKVDTFISFTTGIDFSNIKILENTTENGIIAFVGPVTNAIIERNTLKFNSEFRLAINSKNVIVSKNVISSANGQYDNILLVPAGCSNIKISENIITHNGGGGVAIRVESAYVQIYHNSLICADANKFNDVNAYNNHIIKDNVRYSLDYATMATWTV